MVLYAVALEQNKISLLHTKIKSGLGIHRVLKFCVYSKESFPDGTSGKESTWSAGDAKTWAQSLGWEGPLEKEMATHTSSILAGKIPWTEKPSRLKSMGSQRIGYDWPHTQI